MNDVDAVGVDPPAHQLPENAVPGQLVNASMASPSAGARQRTCTGNCNGSGYTMVAARSARRRRRGASLRSGPATRRAAPSSARSGTASASRSRITGTSGGACTCDGLCNGGGHEMLAKCRQREASDGWDKIAIWSTGNSSGDTECATRDAVCVDVVYAGASTGTCACGSNCGGSGYTMVAHGRSRTASATWDRTATWTTASLYGNVECARVNAECVTVNDAGASRARPFGRMAVIVLVRVVVAGGPDTSSSTTNRAQRATSERMGGFSLFGRMGRAICLIARRVASG